MVQEWSCRIGTGRGEGDMRLGKEEARGFIEEPVEISATQNEPEMTEPHREEEPTAVLRHAPGDAPEEHAASTR